MNVAKQQECRICKGELEDVLDLGIIYRSSFIREDEEISEDQKAPLVLVKCKKCGLTQLKDTIDLDIMYKDQYWYSSALNKSMVSSLRNVVEDIESRGFAKPGDAVLDIGCNDGTLLNLYTYSDELIKVGFDPAPNLNHPDCAFINDYFSAVNYPDNIKKANVITAIAMFYDLPDPNKFLDDIKTVLANKGVFIVQFTDLLSMFKVCAFDNICHEHLEYYRLEDVINLLRKHGLDAIDVSYNNVNGGSVRVTACHEGAYLPKPSVVKSLSNERKFFESNTFATFKQCIETTKFKIKEFLEWAKFHNHKIFIMGASTKGNTLLQICEITDKDAPFAADVNKEKFGLRTLGSNIKIISEEEALIKHPDYFIVAIWHFKDNLLNNSKIKDYLNSGGKLVFPLPEFEVFTDSYDNKVRGFKI